MDIQTLGAFIAAGLAATQLVNEVRTAPASLARAVLRGPTDDFTPNVRLWFICKGLNLLFWGWLFERSAMTLIEGFAA